MIPSATAAFLNEYFERIFVVSVPRLNTRHEKIKEKLSDLNYHFFWGADKLELDIEGLKTAGVYDELQTRKNQRQGKPLSLGELACSLSHRMLYEQMIVNGWQKVLVLEDDVLPQQQVMGQLPDVLGQLPKDWELVYLGYWKHEHVTTGLRIKRFFYKVLAKLGLFKWSFDMVSRMLPAAYSTNLRNAGFHDCTHAYAITLEAARKLLAAQTPVVYRADDALSHTILKGELKAFVTDPKFFEQDEVGVVSEIQKEY